MPASSKPATNLLRLLFITFCAFIGHAVGTAYWDETTTSYADTLGILAGIAFGLGVVLLEHFSKGFTLRMFSCVTFGLLLGFIAARLLLSSGVLARSPELDQWLISLLIYAVFAYIGTMLALRSNRDEFALIIPYVRFRRETAQESPLVVDSNILIEGRLPTIAATGFISNSFVIPEFIVEELQMLADSHDPARRERGRAALAHIRDLQRDTAFSVTITGTALDPFAAVDSKLVQLAKMTGARILTNDHNLCSIARMQGVTALNLHDLTQALQPHLKSGDILDIHLTKEGRDPHQAVGYLKDGTMIVVNQARPHLGKTVRVTISNVVPTQAGRLHFAELKLLLPAEHGTP